MRRFNNAMILLLVFSMSCGPAIDDQADAGAGSSADAAAAAGSDAAGNTGTDSGNPSVAEGDFINGDFEQGSGVGWSEFPGQLIYPAANFGAPAYSGNWVARMGPDNDGSEVIVLQQAVHLAATATTMAFATYIYSEELCDVPWYDNMSLRINDTIIEENDRLCNYDNSEDWLYSTTNISPWAGQTVTVTFRLSTVSGDALASTIYIDKVSIY